MNSVIITPDISSLKPTYQSRFGFRPHPKAEEVIVSCQHYFAVKWPWPSKESKEMYFKLDLERSTAMELTYALDDRIETAVMCNTFWFLFDDLLEIASDDEVLSLLRVVDIFSGNATPVGNNKIEAIASDLYARLYSFDDAVSRELAQLHCEDFCHWCKQVVRIRKESAISLSSFKSYIKYRVNDVGAWMVWSLTRWASNIALTRQVLEHPKVHASAEIAGTHMALVNDLYSYRVELQQKMRKGNADTKIELVNAISVVMKEKDIGVLEAMEWVQTIVSDLEGELLDAVEEAKGHSGEYLKSVEKYAEALQLLLGANVVWSSFCGRYNLGF